MQRSSSPETSMSLAKRYLTLEIFTVGAIIAVSAVAALAQQAPSGNYDNDRKVTLAGIVTRIDWVNPGAFIFVDVKDAGGTVANWAVEVGNPLDLQKDGWKDSAVHIGDAVKVEGIPARGPRRQALATSVVLGRTGEIGRASCRERV